MLSFIVFYIIFYIIFLKKMLEVLLDNIIDSLLEFVFRVGVIDVEREFVNNVYVEFESK